MFNMIIGSSSRRNIDRIAESMPDDLKSNPHVDATTAFRLKNIQDECKSRKEERESMIHRTIPGYIEEDIPIEEAVEEDATTVGGYVTDELQTIYVEYDKSKFIQVLYSGRPSCKHKIQAQWSGIKCTKCGGWYCA